MMSRTHTCGELRKDHIGEEVRLSGWVNNYRDHGGLIFIDLRDREDITQVVFRPNQPDAHALADRLRHEDVVAVHGNVVSREAGMANPKLATGEIEVEAVGLEVLNKSLTPPFTPGDAGRVNEEMRLKYRYIDLRRPRMQEILRTRHRVIRIIRDYFDKEGFYEIETPFLCKSTPEGARDFLVPSRIQHGEFYALPQSPQLFKQILMVSGFDKYVQIVRCFRDEDPRADRQAEFTQLDLELSFATVEDVMAVTEGAVRRVWKEHLDIDVPPIEHMTYDESMARFGTDRPDLRFGMELIDLSDLAAETDFGVFQQALAGGGIVKAICVTGGASMTRKETDNLAEWAKAFGAKGLAVTKVGGQNKLETGIAKFLSGIEDKLIERVGAKEGDLLCFGADDSKIVHRVLGELRVKLAAERDMIAADQWRWVWIVQFPLVDWNADEKRWDSLHHPFTAPMDEDLDKLESDTAHVRSKAYDLVINGSELAGGSIRIHQRDIQSRVFQLLGIGEEEAKSKFGFLLDALAYGAPPHGGIAMGVDRLIMHLCGTDNIRDVIAFPKTQTGADLMTEAPSPVNNGQLNELHLRITDTQ